MRPLRSLGTRTVAVRCGCWQARDVAGGINQMRVGSSDVSSRQINLGMANLGMAVYNGKSRRNVR